MSSRPIFDSTQRLSAEQLERLEKESLTPFRLATCITMWLRSLVNEVRERRDADLNESEVEALEVLVAIIKPRSGQAQRQINALNKVLGNAAAARLMRNLRRES